MVTDSSVSRSDINIIEFWQCDVAKHNMTKMANLQFWHFMAQMVAATPPFSFNPAYQTVPALQHEDHTEFPLAGYLVIHGHPMDLAAA